jgi:hypothetical protein
MVRKQQGRDIDEQEAQLMYDEKTRIFHSMPETQLMPGILSLMEQIHAHGIQIGVVTGSGHRPLIDRLLNDFGQFLEEGHITTAYDVKRGKPNPDPYLTGLQKAGNLKPWGAMVVENAPLGVKAGVAAVLGRLNLHGNIAAHGWGPHVAALHPVFYFVPGAGTGRIGTQEIAVCGLRLWCTSHHCHCHGHYYCHYKRHRAVGDGGKALSDASHETPQYPIQMRRLNLLG